MKKTLKRLFASLMVVVMVLTAAPLSGFVGLELPNIFDIFASAESYSGTCGKNITWSLDSEKGVLYLNGTGDMNDFSYSSIAWRDQRNAIKSVVIQKGITSIGDYAFYYCSNLSSVSIPDTVTTIGDNAFFECAQLTDVSLPEGITALGEACFSNTGLTGVNIPANLNKISESCFSGTKIVNVTIPEGVEVIGESAFNSCYDLKSVTIGSNVSLIGDLAFYWCSGLESIIIPDSVKTIGEGAFNLCDELKSVKIGDGVVTIKSCAFQSCEKLIDLTIGKGVKYIEDAAFENCFKLPAVTLPDGLLSLGFYAFKSCAIEKLVIPDSVKTISGSAFIYNDELTSLTIGSGVSDVGGKAFYSCSSLENVTLKSGIESIAAEAFSDCDELKSIYIPNSVKSIGHRAFYSCSALDYITIGSGIESFGSEAFHYTKYYNDKANWENGILYIDEYLIDADYDCGLSSCTVKKGTRGIADSAFRPSKFTNISICDGVEFIGNSAFYTCNEITSISIPSSVTSIGDSAFQNCRSLSNISIGNSVTNIGKNAFSETAYYKNDSNWDGKVLYIGNYLIAAKTDLTGKYIVKNNTKLIADNAFTSCPVETVEMPDSVKYIGNEVFARCNKLTTVDLSKNITAIESSAFDSCYVLTDLVIPENVTYIGDNAFRYCKNIKNITIPENVTYIGNEAFNDCENLATVMLREKVENIGLNAFYYCKSLKSITVDENNKYYSSDKNGVLFNKTKTELIQYPCANTSSSYTIPNGVKVINVPGFKSCNKLTAITIPKSLECVEESAFYNCNKLEDVYYLDTLEAWDRIDINSGNKYLLDAALHCAGNTLKFEKDRVAILKNDEFKIKGETLGDYSKTNSLNLTFTVDDASGLKVVSDTWTKVNNVSGQFEVTVKGLKDGEYTLTVTDGFGSAECKVIVGFNELHIEFEDLMDNLYSLNGFLFDENGNYFAGALDVIVKLNNRARAEYFFDSFTQKEMEAAALNVKFTMEVNEGFSFDGAGTRYVEYVYEPLEFRKTEEIEAKIYQEDESVKNLTVTYNAYIDDELKHTDTETTTIKSYQEQYADEHINTIYSNTGYHTILNYGFAQGMIPLEDSYDYKFYKFLSDGLVGSGVNMLTELDEKMAYDLVIADIVNGMYSKETIEEASVTIFSEEFTDIVKKVFEITVETAKEIPEAKEKLNKVLLKDFVKMFNGEVSQDAIELFKLTLNDKTGQEKMKALMSKVSKVDSVLTMLNRAGLFLDTYNDYIQATNAIAAMNTFSQMDDTLIAVFNAMYGYSYNNTALQASLKTYLTYMNDTKADRIFRILSAYVANSADTTTKAVLMLVNGIFAEEIKKIVAHPLGKIIKGIGSVISSIELGIYLTSALTNADNYSESVGKVIVAGKLSEVLEKAISELGKNVKNTKSFSNAIILDRGLYLYREIEKYAYTHTIEALEAEYTNALGLDPLTILIWGDKSDEYNKKIIELMIESASLDFLYCHDLNLEKIASQIMSLPTSASSNRKTIPAFKVINVRCPVDVSVYNGKTLVAKFAGDKLEYAADGIVALAYYDEKYICLPSTSDFDIEIKAREEGEMNYSVFEYDESGEFSREISYEDIELSENQKFTGVINDEALTDKGNYDLSTNGDKITDCKDSMDGYDFSEDVSIKVVGNKDVGLNSSTIYRILGSNLPENAKINWSCSDKSVVLKPTENTLSCEVIAGKTGEFTLTVTLEGSNLWDETEFTVTEKQYNLKWFIAGSCITQTYSYGEKIVVPEISIPEEYDFVKWSSEIPETMPAHDVNIIAVLNAKSGKVHSVSIDDISMSYKDSATIIPSINIESGVNYTVTYSSSNTDVVSVDSNGNITTNDKGSATITVTVTDEYGNTVSDTCEVNVKYKWWQWIIVIVLFGWIWY